MEFIDLNNGVWDPDLSGIDQAETAMVAIAAGRLRLVSQLSSWAVTACRLTAP